MKSRQSVIKKSDRAKIDQDPYYSFCCLHGHEGHECGGRVTREHALLFKGKKIQKLWAIIPLCAKYHSVDEYQDNGLLNKEINMWVALNRATDSELREVSKAVDYIRMRNYLNEEYGVYKSKAPISNQAIQY